MKQSLRPSWNVTQALESFAGLRQRINDMTEEEVLAALELETATRRRQSFIDRLISRAVRLREIETKRQLQEKFHAP